HLCTVHGIQVDLCLDQPPVDFFAPAVDRLKQSSVFFFLAQCQLLFLFKPADFFFQFCFFLIAPLDVICQQPVLLCLPCVVFAEDHLKLIYFLSNHLKCMVQTVDIFLCLDQLGKINAFLFQDALSDEAVHTGIRIIGHNSPESPQIGRELVQTHFHACHLKKF